MTLSETEGGEEWLRGLQREAAARVASGVTLTSFGGGEGSGSGVINRDPAELMADLEVCIAFLQGRPVRGEVHPDRRSRRVVVV